MKRGQALVEFALVAPLLVLLIVVIFDLGRGVLAYNDLEHSTSDAVRGLIVDGRPAECAGLTDRDACALAIVSHRTVTASGPFTVSTYCVQPPDWTTHVPCAFGLTLVVSSHATVTMITPLVSQLVGTIALDVTVNGPLETDR